MTQCFAIPMGLLLLFMGLTSIYSALFNQQALVEGQPKASPGITAGIALVMGSVITLVGYILLAHAFGF